MKLLSCAVALCVLYKPALADAAFDNCVRKLCTSIHQQSCWVKGGAAICDEDQIMCSEASDMLPARVIEKSGRRWYIETRDDMGWVSDRVMMINSNACNF